MTTATLPETLSDPAREFAAGQHRLIIGGERLGGAAGRPFPTVDPSTGRPIAEVPQAGAEDVDRAAKAARAAFEEGPWTKLPPAERTPLILASADQVESHADELAELESLDNGKPV